MVHFETTGCRLNQIESESAARIFLDKSFSVSLSSFTAKSAVDPDIVLCVLNTCAVTQKAEQKNRRIIRLLLEKCPRAAVLVTGCYAQLSPENIESIDKRIAALPGLLKSRIEDVVSDYHFSQITKKGQAIISMPGVNSHPFFYDGYRKV